MFEINLIDKFLNQNFDLKIGSTFLVFDKIYDTVLTDYEFEKIYFKIFSPLLPYNMLFEIKEKWIEEKKDLLLFDLEEYFKNYEVILEIDCWSLINSENKKFVKGDYLEKFKKNYTKQFLNYFLDSFISEKSIEITEKIMSEY
jgi:hypothetical protein